MLQDRAGGISAVLKQYMQSLQLSGGKRKRPGMDTPSWDRDDPASNTDTPNETGFPCRPKRKQKGATLPQTRNFSRRRSMHRELSSPWPPVQQYFPAANKHHSSMLQILE